MLEILLIAILTIQAFAVLYMVYLVNNPCLKAEA